MDTAGYIASCLWHTRPCYIHRRSQRIDFAERERAQSFRLRCTRLRTRTVPFPLSLPLFLFSLRLSLSPPFNSSSRTVCARIYMVPYPTRGSAPRQKAAGAFSFFSWFELYLFSLECIGEVTLASSSPPLSLCVCLCLCLPFRLPVSSGNLNWLFIIRESELV